jgi:hypothetical protein
MGDSLVTLTDPVTQAINLLNLEFERSKDRIPCELLCRGSK